MSALEVVMMKRIGELNEEVKGLQAEVERLTKAHSDALADFWAIHKGYFDLKAEVERLRKAGDAMVQLLCHMDVVMDMDSDHPEVEAWNAAKEGRPNE